MVPHTRRRLLHVAAAALTGVAGCNQLTDTTPDTETATRSAEPDARAGGPERTPPTLLLRSDAETPPVRFRDEDEDGAESTPTADRLHRMANLVIDSRERSQRLSIDHPDSQAASSFIAATDFSSETLYVETEQVQECFTLRLCHVSWQPDRIETDYARTVRPYDEHCAVDASAFESRLMRLPVALDAESVNSFATSIGGGGRCDRRRTTAETATGGEN